ncbi:Sigma-54 dependent transcriptional regulator [Stigmatella aurantiaca DW4/3-1]|uniref:Sigma-54 dependent transcriptional regulator n=1 Tax=Stigmatella aurantiaca (strain DW4/3-1) TaxID=378806 RepID=E3FWL6_STIAD|nr:Sigma-54 dependent transcriptional regulator [Stigmatella aurantiaca DW4/3-1]
MRMDERAGQFRLLVVDGTTSSMVDLPPKGIVLIGRAAEADIRLTDRSASRRHARLFLDEGLVRVTDLESHNGVRVNGQAVSQVHTVQPGDVVSLGEVQLVLYSAADSAARSPSTEGTGPAKALELVLGERVIVVADPAVQRLYELIRRLAASALPVLILGETGAGKENAAFALHHWSRRTGKPFVALNCATIAEPLAESELFGHEKGAFTGAAAPKPGLLETAAGGTVFLDEVGELPLAAQAKLLRALETQRILRVGSTKEREIDIRVVAATHRHLEKEVEAGRFRKDLFFRLGAASVVLPPLRDRPDEVSVLAWRFLTQACAASERPPLVLSQAFLDALSRYDWPGNVRELHPHPRQRTGDVPDHRRPATHQPVRRPLRQSFRHRVGVQGRVHLAQPGDGFALPGRTRGPVGPGPPRPLERQHSLDRHLLLFCLRVLAPGDGAHLGRCGRQVRGVGLPALAEQ